MWARIDNGGTVVELTDVDPAGRFHPALTWVDASDVQPPPGVGWLASLSGSSWIFNPPPDTSAAAARAALVSAAQAALDRSDVTMIRCWEHGVAVTPDWRTYRAALRSIVSGSSSDTTLPTQPAYPSGT